MSEETKEASGIFAAPKPRMKAIEKDACRSSDLPWTVSTGVSSTSRPAVASRSRISVSSCYGG